MTEGGGVTAGPDRVERMIQVPSLPSPTPLTLPAPTGGGGGGGGSRGGGGGGGGDMSILPDYTGLYRSDDPRLADYTPGELARMQGGTNINITVNSTIADATLGDTIVNSLREYNRRSGPLQVEIA